MLTGEFNATLDEAGRISLPRKMRDVLEKGKVVLTKGMNNCLRLYAFEEWNEVYSYVMRKTTQFSGRGVAFRRQLIASAHELEFDKQGRIPVTQRLRGFAGLSKDCVIVGQGDYIEIWDEGRYEEYLLSSEDEFKNASEELDAMMMKERDLGNDTGCPHSGAAGGDIAVSLSERQGGVHD